MRSTVRAHGFTHLEPLSEGFRAQRGGKT